MAFDLATAEPVEAPRGMFDLATAQPVGETPPAPAERSLPAQAVRAVGRTVRAGVQGLAALPLGLYDAGAGGIEALTGIPQTRYGPKLKEALTALGLPEAENATERVSEDVASGMAGAGGMVGLGRGMARAGNALVKRIGEVLATAPGLQVTSGATGSGAASVVREEGGGPGAQLAAGLAGASVPALAAAARAAVRGTVRGGESGRQRVEQNIETFEKAGAGTPTVGQASESRVMRAIESGMAKAPGGAGRMAAKAETEAAGLGTKVDSIASILAGRTGAAPAGRQIKGGLEHFVDEFKASSGKLYDVLDRHIPKDKNVQVSNSRAALEKLNADIPGAPNLSKWFKNAKIQGIEGALDKDAPATQAQPIISRILGAGGEQLVTGQTPAKVAGIPYEALKKLRTLVGNEISDSTIASDVPRSKWKPLYAALTKDMAAAAKESGPKAEVAFARASNYYRAGMQRLDDVLGPVMKKGDPEDIFAAALSGTKEGATTISGVMKSLPVESRKVVAGTMLRRLGIATPGKQNELGEVFSSETFLTNWNRISPDSKRVLFSTLTDEMRSDLNKIAKVAANMREGSKVFANPSGTAQATMSGATAGAAFMSVLFGRVDVAVGISATVAGTNATARLITNPNFVHFLAGATKAPVEQVPAYLNQLFQQSLYMKRGEREDVRAFIKEAREALRQQPVQPRQ